MWERGGCHWQPVQYNQPMEHRRVVTTEIDAPGEKRTRFTKAYLDVETDRSYRLTVIGIFRPDVGFVQLVGDGISKERFLEALEGVDIVVTYNGKNFDFGVLERALGIHMLSRFASLDLMYECWRWGLKGGLKAVEQKLGIGRSTNGLDGRDAILLWERYVNEHDDESLALLARYNKEDVLNLVELEQKLEEVARTSGKGNESARAQR